MPRQLVQYPARFEGLNAIPPLTLWAWDAFYLDYKPKIPRKARAESIFDYTNLLPHYRDDVHQLAAISVKKIVQYQALFDFVQTIVPPSEWLHYLFLVDYRPTLPRRSRGPDLFDVAPIASQSTEERWKIFQAERPEIPRRSRSPDFFLGIEKFSESIDDRWRFIQAERPEIPRKYRAGHELFEGLEEHVSPWLHEIQFDWVPYNRIRFPLHHLRRAESFFDIIPKSLDPHLWYIIEGERPEKPRKSRAESFFEQFIASRSLEDRWKSFYAERPELQRKGRAEDLFDPIVDIPEPSQSLEDRWKLFESERPERAKHSRAEDIFGDSPLSFSHEDRWKSFETERPEIPRKTRADSLFFTEVKPIFPWKQDEPQKYQLPRKTRSESLFDSILADSQSVEDRWRLFHAERPEIPRKARAESIFHEVVGESESADDRWRTIESERPERARRARSGELFDQLQEQVPPTLYERWLFYLPEPRKQRGWHGRNEKAEEFFLGHELLIASKNLLAFTAEFSLIVNITRETGDI